MVHQSRSAADTSDKVPWSLFKTAWLCWMCHGGVVVLVFHLRFAEVHCMHSRSWTCVLPGRMLACPHSSVHIGIHLYAHLDTFLSGQCMHLGTLHRGWNTQLCVHLLGLGPSDVSIDFVAIFITIVLYIHPIINVHPIISCHHTKFKPSECFC